VRTKYVFIHFADLGLDESGVHHIYSCRNNKSGHELGKVFYYAQWKMYVYFPNNSAVYSLSCLKDIAQFLKDLLISCEPNLFASIKG